MSSDGNAMKKTLEARAARFQTATSGSNTAPTASSGHPVSTPTAKAAVSVDPEKFAARAARFSDVQSSSSAKITQTATKGSPVVSTAVDPTKLAQRAARFKEMAPNPSPATTVTSIGVSSVAAGDDGALKKRAERFASMNK